MLSEVLLVIMIIVLVLGLSLPLGRKPADPLAAEKYQAELLALQSKAMAEGETQKKDTISFNPDGHINLAGTVKFGKNNLVLFLGMGRSEIRQGNVDD